MNKRLRSFFNMLAAVKAVCIAHQSVWTGNVLFEDAYNKTIIDTETALRPMQSIKASSTQGITGKKQRYRAALNDATVYMASRIALYAATYAKETLEREAHLPPSAAKSATADAIAGIATRIANLAAANLPDLAPFGITGAEVDALRGQVAEFAAMKNAPAEARKNIKDAGLSLEALHKQATARLRILDGHMLLWRDTNAGFYTEYFIARRRIKPGYRTRSLELRVEDAAGAPVPGAAFSMLSQKLMRRTSARGICRIGHLPEGTHRAQVLAEGYVPQEVSWISMSGEGVKLKVVMEAL